ncbi:MAG: pyruvate dehydrogenase (acetyl-transferring), homodimeric type [Proteobacteria bacterium]|jgi:pyruvate dehydrogenase E1 component|nr:pyruvate dehydrogenase (acetyl-transferring), homodimeric type [Pseudomonadota bacterium]
MINNSMLDKLQIKEWLESIDNVIDYDSTDGATELVKTLANRLKSRTGINTLETVSTDYVNTILSGDEVSYPGNKIIENKLSALIRWNATAMVLKANKVSSELGGHIASYASSASLYEVGFNHFWQAPNGDKYGDMVFFQGHSSPGIYARSFIEGRLSEDRLTNFRQESAKVGLSSYPHPWLMPDYWQFPTVSMGLGPLMAIYQARFMKYMGDRGLINADGRKVWCFIGDGETSEPETLGNIHIASRENLDNLIFVINCNLQRLDGPVNGNGKIIQEMEGLFTGAGWKVIKIVWGKGWDKLLAKDSSGKLKQLMMQTVDGEYQMYRAQDGAYIRQHFFAKFPETLDLVSDMSDDDIWQLTRGGHDVDKIYAAYHEAVNNPQGKPVIILAKTIKGYGMKGEGESQNVAHQQKKLSVATLKKICEKFAIPLTDAQIEELPFLMPEKGSEEHDYLHSQRTKLGGYYPIRKPIKVKLNIPPLSTFETLLNGTKDREMSTTMAFVRMLNTLIKDKEIGKLIVPIVPDESRTFGMEGMFRQLGIWSHKGQLYTPEDSGQLMFYKEEVKGQIFQEGINEPGAISTWIAAATSYANHGMAMLPFYIYYSMFGFQRVGDLAWAAGDMRARGFLIGGTAGRTTLNGEGLQHQDGHSHIQSGLIPNCESYDPTFAYEVAVIVHHGLKEMYVENKDKFYYITVMNENYQHPEMPKGVEDGIIQGCYLLKTVSSKLAGEKNNKLIVNLMGSGTIFREVIAAADLLAEDFGIDSNIFSATSFNKLRRDGMNVTRHNMLHPLSAQQKPFITKQLETTKALTTVVATDYVRNYADQVREYIPHDYIVLGTDGYGRSDFRVALREFFEVNRYYVVIAALSGLVKNGLIEAKVLATAIKKYKINVDKLNPWEV